MKLAYVLLGFILITACGDDSSGGDDNFSIEAFRQGNDLMHAIHVEAFDFTNGTVPENYTYECAGGGTVDMVATSTSFSSDEVMTLYHRLNGCVWNGNTLNGDLDYLALTPCATGGLEIDIQGSVEFEGSLDGQCTYQSKEQCDGSFTPDRCE